MFVGTFLGAGVGLALFEFGFLTMINLVQVVAVLSLTGGIAGGSFTFSQIRIIRLLYLGIAAGMSFGLLLCALRLLPMTQFIAVMIGAGVIGGALGVVCAFLGSQRSPSPL